MSTSLDPLKVTAQDLHRFWFVISSEKQWYEVMRECRDWFGTNWQSQSKVRRKLTGFSRFTNNTLAVWFDIPDPQFATWIAVKYSMQVYSNAKRPTGK